jgi:hypothetical protein
VQIIVSNFAVQGLPASQTVLAGVPATYTVTVSAVGGEYSNSVTLSCTNLPAETSCAFNPPAVTPGAGSATSTLAITTTPHPPAAASLNIFPSSLLKRPRSLVWLAVLVLALGLIAGMRSGRRKLAVATAFSGLLVLLGIQFACGGGGGGGTPTPTPSAKLSVTNMNFGPQLIGTPTLSQPVSLSNSGTAALAISSISASGDFAQANNCGASLGAGGNCKIDVTFTPTAAGTRAGALSVTDNALGSPRTASLNGTGLAGTAAGTYPITVSGTAGALVNSGMVTLDVQ